MFEIVFTAAAKKALVRRLPAKDAAGLVRRLRRIAADPFVRRADVAAIKGARDCHRVRHGEWRAIYAVHRDTRTVEVLLVGHRKDVYR